MKGSWRWVNNESRKWCTYRSRLRIPSFSSKPSFDRLYLSHSAVILSSKPPKVMNVTTISGRAWMALQATPQSGRKDPVINASYNNQLNIDGLENIPHIGIVNKTRCPFRPWSEPIPECIYAPLNWTVSVSQWRSGRRFKSRAVAALSFAHEKKHLDTAKFKTIF